MRSGFDGKVGWTQDSQGRVREKVNEIRQNVAVDDTKFSEPP